MPSQSAENGDFQIIKPQVDLRSKIRKLVGKEAERDPVAAAESAVQQLATRFSLWMDDEIETMLSAWQTLKSDGFDEEPCAAFSRSVHDIKGQAATFGYPLAGEVAGSLSKIFEYAPDADTWPNQLVEQHVMAIRAMVVEHDRDNYDITAKKLCNGLIDVTDEFLASLPANS